MKIFMRNGKPILRNGKFVTGDCCCGCESDVRCGLPHTAIDLSDPSVVSGTGQGLTASDRPTLTLSFMPNGGGEAGTKSTVQIARFSTAWRWTIETNPEPTWGHNCYDKCSSRVRTSYLKWAGDPNVELFEYGTLTLRLETAADARFVMNVTVLRSYLSEVTNKADGLSYRAARYNPPNGDSFTMSVENSNYAQIGIGQRFN